MTVDNIYPNFRKENSGSAGAIYFTSINVKNIYIYN